MAALPFPDFASRYLAMVPGFFDPNQSIARLKIGPKSSAQKKRPFLATLITLIAKRVYSRARRALGFGQLYSQNLPSP
mgnify:CR=1 FL=1